MRRRHDQQYVLIDFGAAKSVAGLGGQATTIGTPGEYQLQLHGNTSSPCLDWP